MVCLRSKVFVAMIRVICLVAFCFGLADSIAAAVHPNIVIILVDDMGYGDPSCYNPNSKIPTPNIDRLAAEGMRFTDAHAAGPLCHVSRYGLMTGRYPFRGNSGAWRKRATIDEDCLTVGKLLQSEGYRTAMVGKWHLGFDERGYEHPMPGGPVDRGFDRYFGIRASTDIPPYFYIRDDRAVSPPTAHIEANYSDGWSPIQGAFWRAGGISPGLELKYVLPRFTNEAVDVIWNHARHHSGKPLFMYLAYPAPHTPWLPLSKYVGKSGAGMYGDFTVMVDDMIGRVLGALNDAGMADDTLVLFSSDNGPVWRASDVERWGHDSSGGLRGMKADAWECGHRMPFIVRWPERVKAETTSNQLIGFTDIMATFASVVGAELPEGAGPDSFDFSPVLLGKQPESEPIRESLVVHSGGGVATIRSGSWKLVTGLGSGGFSRPRRIQPSAGDPAGQLYHLGNDIGETKNLYLEEPDIVARLTAELERILASGRTRP
ncbi:MAG: Arylsulfatase [Verrucomicrobia subdivision 3 bacterium]|nr:Arylsulfatase [Limisphaerales bacterium]MCS1413158.1 Arylsulfatase [Limisphaerales bacterium]